MGTARKILMWMGLAMMALIVIFAGNAFGSAGQNDVNVLMDTMNQADVAVDQTTFTSSNTLAKNMREKKIPSVQKQVKRAFSVNMDEAGHPESHRMFEYNGRKKLSPDATVHIKITGRQTGKDRFSIYLLTKLTTDQSDEKKLNQYNRYLSKHLKEIDVEPNVQTTIQGTVDEKMKHDEQYDFLSSMFENLDGHITEGLNEEKVISLTGFSKRLDHSVQSQKERINLQIASRYDTRNQETMITIGTPVITTDY